MKYWCCEEGKGWYSNTTEYQLFPFRVYRFVSQDTFGGEMATPISQNLYLYVEGDPVNHIDPSGHAPLSIGQDGESVRQPPTQKLNSKKKQQTRPLSIEEVKPYSNTSAPTTSGTAASDLFEHYAPTTNEAKRMIAQEIIDRVGNSGGKGTLLDDKLQLTLNTAMAYNRQFCSGFKNFAVPGMDDGKNSSSSISVAVKNAIMKKPGLNALALWELPAKDVTSSPYPGITRHDVTWIFSHGSRVITVYEGSKASMAAWADHMANVAGFFDFFGLLEVVLSVLGLKAFQSILPSMIGTFIKKVTELIGGSLWAFVGFLVMSMAEWLYTAWHDKIIAETYFLGDYCYFTDGASITGTMGVSRYDNEGNLYGRYGR